MLPFSLPPSYPPAESKTPEDPGSAHLFLNHCTFLHSELHPESRGWPFFVLYLQALTETIQSAWNVILA